MRRPTLLACGVILIVAGCGANHRPPGTQIRFTVVDQELRKPGESCSGAGGYLYVHRGAPYSVVDPAGGAVLARGELPDGLAVRLAAPIQGAALEPTGCLLTFSAKLPHRARYALRLDQGPSIPFGPAQTVRIRIP